MIVNLYELGDNCNLYTVLIWQWRGYVRPVLVYFVFVLLL